MKQIMVSNRHWITDFTEMNGLPPHIIVSITDPGTLPAILRQNHQTKGVLRLEFEDVDGDQPDAMTTEQAEAIANFINEHKDSIDIIVVHCEAGVSRSAGVAAAISLVVNGDDTKFFHNPKFCPNIWCYRLVLDAFDLMLKEDEIAEKLSASEKLFRERWGIDD